MKIFKYALLSLVATFMLNGCSSANLELTTEQINNINNISVRKPRFSKNIELEIEGGLKTSEVEEAFVTTGSLELMLLGGLIDKSIHANKQNKFEMKYKNELSKIREYKVDNIDNRIESIMLSVLEKDSFLNTKTVNNSSTNFDSEISLFGLEKRYSDQNNEAYLGAKIVLVVFLIGNDGKHLIDDVTLITNSKDSYSVTELSNDNTLVEKLFEQAYNNFEKLFTFHLNRTFKNRTNFTK